MGHGRSVTEREKDFFTEEHHFRVLSAWNRAVLEPIELFRDVGIFLLFVWGRKSLQRKHTIIILMPVCSQLVPTTTATTRQNYIWSEIEKMIFLWEPAPSPGRGKLISSRIYNIVSCDVMSSNIIHCTQWYGVTRPDSRHTEKSSPRTLHWSKTFL